MVGRGVTVRLKHVQVVKDRYGREHFYFRQPGLPRVALKGSPGSPEFIAAYQAAKVAAPLPPKEKPLAGGPGSIQTLVAEYYRSPRFLKTKASSQKTTRGILDRFAKAHGHRMVADLQPKHLVVIMGKMSATPSAANNLLKKLRALYQYAILMGYCRHDPTTGVDKYNEGTHHTWTENEIALYQERWEIGTLERTAFALALYTGQRCSDLASALWTDFDLKANAIKVVQEKTGTRLLIPIHSELRRVLEGWPRKHATILVGKKMRALSSNDLSNFMAKAIDGARLPDHCVLHGLRKAAARRLAQVGCSTHQIMAITGHKSLSEIARYTAAVEQEGLAKEAIVKLEDARRQRTNAV